MSIDLARIYPRLTEAVRTRNLVPLLGAGISKHATGHEPHAFPNWSDLIQELARRAEDMKSIGEGSSQEIDRLVMQGKHLMAAQALKHALGIDEFNAILWGLFKPPRAKPGAIHRRLFALRAPLIVTTNYDTLLEDCYANEFGASPYVLTYKYAEDVQKFLQNPGQGSDIPLIFKIHGTIAPSTDVILTERDYRQLVYSAPAYRTVLSAIFVTKVVLMIGFSFNDPELRLLTESLRVSLKYSSQPDYLVLPEGDIGQIEKSRLLDDFGVRLIEYDKSNGHAELVRLVDHLATFAPQQTVAAET